MVYVVENGHGNSISNPDEAICISYSTNILENGAHPIILSPVMGKQ